MNLFSILADLNNARFWMLSFFTLISNSPSPLTKTSGIVSIAPNRIGITLRFLYYILLTLLLLYIINIVFIWNCKLTTCQHLMTCLPVAIPVPQPTKSRSGLKITWYPERAYESKFLLVVQHRCVDILCSIEEQWS